MQDPQNHGGRPRSRSGAIRTALRFWREQRGLSQVSLGEQAAVRADQISRYENGDAIPTLPEIEALARVLKVTIADLYSADLLRAIAGAAEVA